MYPLPTSPWPSLKKIPFSLLLVLGASQSGREKKVWSSRIFKEGIQSIAVRVGGPGCEVFDSRRLHFLRIRADTDPLSTIHLRLAWDQALQWGKMQKTGSNRKDSSERGEPSGWIGNGERAAEPGDMPLMPPFHDSRFWCHALIGQMPSCWQIRSAVDSIALRDLLQKENEAFKLWSFSYVLHW